MAVALSLISSQVAGDGGRKRIVKTYTVTLSGSYANSGTTGDLIDFQGATNTNRIERAKFARNPDQWEVLNQPVGFVMRIQPGTAFGTWGLRFFQSDDAVDPLDEIANGAYDSALTADTSLKIRLSGPAL